MRLSPREMSSNDLRRVAVVAFTVLISGAACTGDWPDPPPVDAGEFAAAHEEWRSNREARMVTPPGGAVLWMGLFPLAQGEVQMGSDPDLTIVLPEEDAPALVGTLTLTGQEVAFAPAPGSPLALQDGPVITESTVLENDRSGNTTYITLGSLGMRIHAEPGTDRLWLRVWDTDLPLRETFELPEYYPVDTEWRVAARLELYPELRGVPLADVTGGMIEQNALGELVFERDGREHTLIAVGTEESSSYFIMMWDSTATTETYQAGRYLRVEKVDEEGWTTIDFNRSYNAPCVFTAFSVCALPPRENWLDLPVTAGEKRPDKPAYEGVADRGPSGEG